jgi:hypothetical protein
VTLFGQLPTPPDACFNPFRLPVSIVRRVGKAGDPDNRADDSKQQQDAGQT